MSQFEWCRYKWNTEERWGNIHPINDYAWYDPECVYVDNNNNLNLFCKYNPTKIIDCDGKKHYPKYGVGLVSSDKDNPIFKFGRYIWIAKFPKGKHLWPALWMWSWDSWPPEIDVAEGWTNCLGGYWRFFDWNIQTNIHTSYTDHDYSELWSIFKNYKNPHKHYIKYEMVWMPDKIEFWYDDKIIRVITDKTLLKYLDDNTEYGMNVIMNNNITKDYNSNISDSLIIQQFNYVPLT